MNRYSQCPLASIALQEKVAGGKGDFIAKSLGQAEDRREQDRFILKNTRIRWPYTPKRPPKDCCTSLYKLPNIEEKDFQETVLGGLDEQVASVELLRVSMCFHMWSQHMTGYRVGFSHGRRPLS